MKIEVELPEDTVAGDIGKSVSKRPVKS